MIAMKSRYYLRMRTNALRLIGSEPNKVISRYRLISLSSNLDTMSFVGLTLLLVDEILQSCVARKLGRAVITLALTTSTRVYVGKF